MADEPCQAAILHIQQLGVVDGGVPAFRLGPGSFVTDRIDLIRSELLNNEISLSVVRHGWELPARPLLCASLDASHAIMYLCSGHYNIESDNEQRLFLETIRWIRRIRKVAVFLLVAVIMVLLYFAALNPPKVSAVPSYARQTGLACSGCHYAPPELNPAGRRFKLLGYVDRADETKVVKADGRQKRARRSIFSLRCHSR